MMATRGIATVTPLKVASWLPRCDIGIEDYRHLSSGALASGISKAGLHK
jgi:hypothetical protein